MTLGPGSRHLAECILVRLHRQSNTDPTAYSNISSTRPKFSCDLPAEFITFFLSYRFLSLVELNYMFMKDYIMFHLTVCTKLFVV